VITNKFIVKDEIQNSEEKIIQNLKLQIHTNLIFSEKIHSSLKEKQKDKKLLYSSLFLSLSHISLSLSLSLSLIKDEKKVVVQRYAFSHNTRN
jgi:hypothetical protein